MGDGQKTSGIAAGASRGNAACFDMTRKRFKTPDHGVKISRDCAEHDHILATHYLTVWEHYVAFREKLVPNASEAVDKYLMDIRLGHLLVSFIAFDGTTAVVSVSCRSDFKAYPVVLKPYLAKKPAYGVCTPIQHIPRQMNRSHADAAALHHLKSSCDASITLHSSKAGAPLHQYLGFSDTSEMKVKC